MFFKKAAKLYKAVCSTFMTPHAGCMWQSSTLSTVHSLLLLLVRHRGLQWCCNNLSCFNATTQNQQQQSHHLNYARSTQAAQGPHLCLLHSTAVITPCGLTLPGAPRHPDGPQP